MNKKKILIISIIAAVVLVGVMLLLIFLPKGGSDQKASTVDEGVKLELTTDSEGVHQAEVPKDEKGEVVNNSYGTLIEYYPADISVIHVENAKGTLDVLSNTPKGEATIYTIKGYEDFDQQAGVADLIASSASKLSFEKVAGVDQNGSSDFGFDDPRSIVTVTYTDKTKSIITVGADAPQSAGTYIKFGDGDEIFLVDTETAAPFDYGLTDFISLSINKSADSVEEDQASSITLETEGQKIVLEPYTGERYGASYEMTSPRRRIANESESSKVAGGIRGLYALRVLMVNPSDSQLDKLGLSKPHAAIEAVYPDTTVGYYATAPNSDGEVVLMEKGGRVVYAVAADKVTWASTNYEKLCSEYVLYPKMTALTGMKVESGESYSFELSSKEVVTTDNDGNENTSTSTSVFYGGKEIQLGDFSAYYDEVSLIELADAKEESVSGKPELTVTYSYSDGGSDAVEFYPSEGNRYTAVLNGEVIGRANKADVTRAANGAKETAEKAN